MTWQQRYRKMLDSLHWTNEDVARLLEKPETSVRSQTANQKQRNPPAWMKALVVMFEHLRKGG